VGFAEAGDPEFSVEHADTENATAEAGQDLFEEERLQFARGAGKEGHHAALVFEPEPGSGAAGIFEDFGAFWDHGLAEIDGGHVALEAAEAGFDGADDFVVALEAAAEKFGYGFAGEVVFGGAEAAAGDYHGDAIEGIAEGLGEEFAIVADDGFAEDFDAEFV